MKFTLKLISHSRCHRRPRDENWALTEIDVFAFLLKFNWMISLMISTWMPLIWKRAADREWLLTIFFFFRFLVDIVWQRASFTFHILTEYAKNRMNQFFPIYLLFFALGHSSTVMGAIFACDRKVEAKVLCKAKRRHYGHVRWNVWTKESSFLWDITITGTSNTSLLSFHMCILRVRK